MSHYNENENMNGIHIKKRIFAISNSLKVAITNIAKCPLIYEHDNLYKILVCPKYLLKFIKSAMKTEIDKKNTSTESLHFLSASLVNLERDVFPVELGLIAEYDSDRKFLCAELFYGYKLRKMEKGSHQKTSIGILFQV